jgi:hypothetical protein
MLKGKIKKYWNWLITAVLIIIILGLVVLTVQAQDLTGNWEGICKKDGNEFSFKAESKIEHTEGNVEMLLKISYPDRDWFCVQKITGKTEGKNLVFKAEKNILQKHGDGYWLLLEGTLIYDAKEDRLHGWVDAYDTYYQERYSKHDYIELYRKINNL